MAEDQGGPFPPLSHEEIARYSRHLTLGEVGMAGQQRLKASRVLCVGAGGLGSPALMYLAAAGVGTIGLVDFDVVDASNLQRQIIHGTPDVGRPKVDSAAERIRAINPHVRVEVHHARITSDNALRLVSKYDAVVDGTDNFPTRYLVNDACVLCDKPYIYGSIFKFEGQASVFNLEGGPNYRDLYPEPPPPGLVPSCAEGGVLGILPGVIGVIQATETVKLLLGLGSSLSGRLLLYDAMAMQFRELALARDPNRAPITELVDYEQFCMGATPTAHEEPTGFQAVAPRVVATRRNDGWRPYVLDVRSDAEAAIAQLGFTDLVHPHSRLHEVLDALPGDRDLLVYCKSGGRSTQACQALLAAGFQRVFNLTGGISAWATQVDPTVPRY